MTRKEINEIKSQYTLEDCAIARMSGCYVDVILMLSGRLYPSSLTSFAVKS